MIPISTCRLLQPLLQGPPRFFRHLSATNAPKSLRNLHSHPFRNLYKINKPIIVVQSLIRPLSVISSVYHIGRVAYGGVARVSIMSGGGSSGDEQVVQFHVSPSTTLKIQRGDITKWSIDGSSDAIVNPANERMLGGGGADGAIHRAAGPELRAACYEVPEVQPGVRCPTGEARITPGFKLPSSHVIHTVGPIYDTNSNPAAYLRDAYKNSLAVAKENNIKYVAFPAISCGVFGYPFDEAATVALSTVKEHANDIKEVHFVLFSDDIYDVWVRKANELLQK